MAAPAPLDRVIAHEALIARAASDILRPSKKSSAVTVDVQKMDDTEGLVFGWAYVNRSPNGEVVEDSHGTTIEDAELERAAYEYVAGHGIGDVMHDYGSQMRLIESMVWNETKRSALGIPEGTMPSGWWVGYRIEDEETKRAVAKGEYPMFSIGGKAQEVEA